MLRLLRAWPAALASAGALATVLAVTVVPASAADISPAPQPIGPKQFFTGLVNGQTGQATILMGCFGPSAVGQTGHPLSGQTVEVLPASDSTVSDVGFTGDAATAVQVDLGDLSPQVGPVASTVLLTDYGVRAEIPTTLTLPCGGTGVVEFRPSPTSSTARSAFVKVSYVGQP